MPAAMLSHTDRAVAALRTLREQGTNGAGEISEISEQSPPPAPGPVWDEQAACLLVGSWAMRIGTGWPAGLAPTVGEAGVLWDRYERDLDAAFTAESWEALHQAFAAFRHGAAPIIRAWRRSQTSVPTLPHPAVAR